MSDNTEELKHDFNTDKGRLFKAIGDRSKELGIINRLSIYHLSELANAAYNELSRPQNNVSEALNRLILDLSKEKINGHHAKVYVENVLIELYEIKNLLGGA